MEGEELIYFDNEKIRLKDMSIKHPNYTRIYMNISKTKNSTSITLSKHEGDILYILSNVDNEKYSSYFKKEIIEQKIVDVKEREDEQTNPSKRAKQSTLSSFIRK